MFLKKDLSTDKVFTPITRYNAGMSFIARFFSPPIRQYLLIVFVSGTLVANFFIPGIKWIIWIGACVGALAVFVRAAIATYRLDMTIDTFNALALTVALGMGEATSAAFIVLMLAFADLLDHFTESRTGSAVEELLRLKPHVAFREDPDGVVREIPIEKVVSRDVVVVKAGDRVPVDGVIIWGDAHIDESSLTGESHPTHRHRGDAVFSSTLNTSDPIKVRATRTGKDSVLERMALLVAGAQIQKSHTERLADRFAGLFLPVVLLLGAATYFIGGPLMMVALFLVACADDIAVALPLAVTASIGVAAKHGVIVKGGKWLAALALVDTIVLDKTGTLTHGTLRVTEVELADGIDPEKFWEFVFVAEKMSEHPVGRAITSEATRRSYGGGAPEKIHVAQGAGIRAHYQGNEIVIGNDKVVKEFTLPFTDAIKNIYAKQTARGGQTAALVYINNAYAGMISVADSPREEAREALRAIRALGIERIIMLTGDNEEVAKEVANNLGITAWTSGVTPEAKLDLLDQLADKGFRVAMIGDGINDAPALARADVGIAMGGIGTATTVEAADIVITSDDLRKIPETIALARRTMSVINWDMGTWFVTNMGGFALVWLGILGPVLAAAYNFGTDFLPVLNSARLFRDKNAIKMHESPRK